MARFIMIDSTSGFIFGDTAADLVSYQSDWTEKTEADVIEAVRLMDEAIGEHGRRYVFHPSDPGQSVTGYRVYDASDDQVICVTDGQDAELINDVETSCPFLGFVRVALDGERI